LGSPVLASLANVESLSRTVDSREGGNPVLTIMTRSLNRAMTESCFENSRVLRARGRFETSPVTISSAILQKAEKKESKILQNEATKPNGINKST
jgi:hypothetical protein